MKTLRHSLPVLFFALLSGTTPSAAQQVSLPTGFTIAGAQVVRDPVLVAGTVTTKPVPGTGGTTVINGGSADFNRLKNRPSGSLTIAFEFGAWGVIDSVLSKTELIVRGSIENLVCYNYEQPVGTHVGESYQIRQAHTLGTLFGMKPGSNNPKKKLQLDGGLTEVSADSVCLPSPTVRGNWDSTAPAVAALSFWSPEGSHDHQITKIEDQ